jgi:hypothetical protein
VRGAAPIAATWSASVGIRASIRAVDTQSAVQTTSLWVIPGAIVLIRMAGRVAVRSVIGGLIGSLIGGLLAVWAYRGNLKRFEREEILARWK